MTRKLRMGRMSVYVGRPVFWVTRFWGTNFKYVYAFGLRVEWWRWTQR